MNNASTVANHHCSPPPATNGSANNTLAAAAAQAQAESGAAVMSILGTPGVSLEGLLLLLQRRINDVDGQIAAVIKNIEVHTSEARRLQDVMIKMRSVQSALVAKGGENAKSTLQDFDVEGQSAYDFIRDNGLEEYFNYSETDVQGYDRAIQLAEENGGVLTQEVWNKEMDRQRGKSKKKARPKVRKEGRKFLENVAKNPIAFSNGSVSADELRKVRSKAQFDPTAKLDKNSVDQSIEKLQTEIRQINSSNELDMIELQSAMQQRSQQITLVTNMIKSLQDAEKKIVDNIR